MRRLFSVLAILFLAVAAVFGPIYGAQATESVIVFGGSGQLGSEIVRALVAKGHKVTVFVRSTSKLDRLDGLKVDRVEGDVMNQADVTRAFKTAKFTVVVDALARGRTGEADFYDVSEQHISAAAKAAGVKQAILHSSVGAGDSRAIYPKDMLTRMSPVLAAKEAGEKAVIASGMTYTIIRNAVLHDPPGWVEHAKLYEDHTKFGAVTRPGLARLTVECIANKACANKIYHGIDDALPMPEGR